MEYSEKTKARSEQCAILKVAAHAPYAGTRQLHKPFTFTFTKTNRMSNPQILDDFSGDEFLENDEAWELADKGVRFVNFIIDRIALLGCGFVFGIFLVLIGAESYLDALERGGVVADWIFGVIIGTVYYAGIEYLTEGRSLGKLVTKTKVVSVHRSPLTFPQILKRTLSRFVPFEPFSFFGNDPVGWHDDWSDTRVVKIR